MKSGALRLGCTVAVSALCWARPAPLRAAEPAAAGDQAEARARAQELLQRGNELFRAGDAGEALRSYREAYDAFPSPKLFFNIGRSEEALAQRSPAIRDLSRFLREATDADPLVRGEAQERVTALAAALVAVELTGVPVNATVDIDSQAAGLTPLEGPLWVEPGPHRLSVAAAGRALWVTSFEGRAGSRLSVALPEQPLDAGSRAAADSAGRGPGQGTVMVTPPPGSGSQASDAGRPLWRRWWVWAAVGVLLVGGAATFLIIRARDPCGGTTYCE